MSENNDTKSAPETDTEGLTKESAAEMEDVGIIFIPDDGPTEEDADAAEQRVFERIQERQSNASEYVAPELTIWQKLDNFWYRNKALIIVGVIAAVMIVYLAIISIPESYDGDATIYVSSSDYRVSVTYEVQDELEKYISDINGDGESTLDVKDFNTAGSNGFIVMANYVLMQDQLSGEPLSMLWVVDKDLFDMMVNAYGEELFESFEGAPLWIELTCNDLINSCVEIGESPRLGICLRRMTDDLRKDKDLCASYEAALEILENLREEHPEMFEPQE